MRIAERIRQLEEATASERNRHATCAADADQVLRTVERLASRFSSSAATISLAERVATMSPAQHCAWEMRFASEQTPVAQIMAMHGRPFPSMEDSHASR